MIAVRYQELLQTRVGAYEPIIELAHGGMARVFVARKHPLSSSPEKLFALKLLLPHLQSDEQYRELFRNEARVGLAIRHDNVVAVLDAGEDQGFLYLIMEFIRGMSFASVMDQTQGHPMRCRFGLSVLAHAALGLHAAHVSIRPDGEPLDVVHRDVSPENILVSYDGQVKVADFGIAEARGRAALTRVGELRGKLAYLAPEQVTRDHPTTARSDIWALGVLLWELLSERRLFADDNDAAALWNVLNKPVPALNGGLPARLREIVAACLARDPELRPQTALEVHRALLEALAELGGAPDTAQCMSEWFAERRELEQRRLAAQLHKPLQHEPLQHEPLQQLQHELCSVDPAA